MSFTRIIKEYEKFDFSAFLNSITSDKIEKILSKQRIGVLDFLALLSDEATKYLEPIAQKAHNLTQKYFGNVVFMFTPMYISNYCNNTCKYCSFNRTNKIIRKKLTMEEIKKEAGLIANTGMRHILVLTGESREKSPVEYITESISYISTIFASTGIEIYPLSEKEYSEVIAAGVDSLTIYQEVYDRADYQGFHTGGPKADYEFRLDSSERACLQSMRSVTIGALLGLSDIRKESFFTALHFEYLQKKYPATEISISFPRLRPITSNFTYTNKVSDRFFVQLLMAFRLFAPYGGITISTRERALFRDSILPLGVTRMSAGVSTSVGGHGDPDSINQFEIADTRSVKEIRDILQQKGYQPVMHDWSNSFYKESHEKNRL